MIHIITYTTFKLVGASGDFNAKIQEISINSPLGNAVYKKKIGDTCSYSANNRNFSVLLKEKMDLTKANDVSVKKLKK